MEVHCPVCQEVINIAEQYLGQAMKCPLCTSPFLAPSAPARPSAAPEREIEVPRKPARPEPPPRPPGPPSTLEEWFLLGILVGGIRRGVTDMERLALFGIGALFCFLCYLLLPISLGQWIGFSTIPQTVASALAVAVIVWKINSTDRAADNWSFVAAGIGLQILFMNLHGIGESLVEECDIEDLITFQDWLEEKTANGKLALYLSGLLFSVRLFFRGIALSIYRFAYLQYAVFGAGAMILSDPHNFDSDIYHLNLLAWVFFVVLNNWFLSEDFMVSTKQPIRIAYFIRLSIYNAVIIFASLLLRFEETGFLFYLTLFCGFVCWAITVAWLYRHGKPQFGPRTRRILDRILIDPLPEFLLSRKGRGK